MGGNSPASDKHAAEPRLGLVNKDSLDKILKAEVFVNSEGQLHVAHLILGIKEEEEEQGKQEAVVEVSDLEDPFQAFYQPLSSAVSTSVLENREGSMICVEDRGIQRKPRSTLQELLESEPGRDDAVKRRNPSYRLLPPSRRPKLTLPSIKERGRTRGRR
ncbi:hypothetical protein SO802_019476 [Lithocarpus litseifolius]|uniref:Uncharacterized protein n=1 Tax=Lithocarpus litseifolius TaxID=425828 RepID=A0AAW2CQW3_9ROSI